MSVYKIPTTFVPAFSTTTTSPGTVAEGFSDLGLAMDSYTDAADIAASDELIAHALGGNFVSGVRLDPAGDLVARAKEFAEELPRAGLFLARTGFLAAEGVIGAGAGVALAAARSAVLVDGDLFAAGDEDDEHVGVPSTIPPWDMLTPFSEGQELEKEGDRLIGDKKHAEAFGKFEEAAAKYKTARMASAYARALFKKASSFEEAVRLRQIDPKGREPAALYKDAADAYPEALGQSPELNSERAGGLFVFARALERSGPKFKGEAVGVYEESAGLFFALDDLDSAAAAINNAQVLTAKRRDSAKVSLRVFKGDIHMAMGEYGIALDNYRTAAKIGRALTLVPDDTEVAEKMFVLAERLEIVEGLEPLGAKGFMVFKSLAVENEHFRALPSAEQVKVAKEIAAEWKVEKPSGATEITTFFIRTHYPTVKEGEALLEEGQTLMSEKRYQKAEEKFREAAQKFHAALLHDRDAEASHLQLGAIDVEGVRKGGRYRKYVVDQELTAWGLAADEATGLEKALFLGNRAYALVAAGRVDEAAKIISGVHHLNARGGKLGAEANARMHESFGNLALEKRQRLLAVNEFEIAAQENYGMKRFSKAASLYGRNGGLQSLFSSSYENAVYSYELADAAATKARRSDLVWEYVTKKIEVLFKMDKYVEAASLADELLKRSKRSDKREEALGLRRNGVRWILEGKIDDLPREANWYLDTIWEAFSSLRSRGREGFWGLKPRNQWESVVQTVGEWMRLSEEEREKFTDVGEFAVKSK